MLWMAYRARKESCKENIGNLKLRTAPGNVPGQKGVTMKSLMELLYEEDQTVRQIEKCGVNMDYDLADIRDLQAEFEKEDSPERRMNLSQQIETAVNQRKSREDELQSLICRRKCILADIGKILTDSGAVKCTSDCSALLI